jgi:hypothetical protein
MKPAYKYLLIVSSTAALALGLLLLLTNTQPNMEVVITNKSDQSIALVDLKTKNAGENIRLRGVDIGTEVTVKLHTDGDDSLSIFIRFADGKEIQGESIPIEPGARMTQSVMEEKIIAGPNSQISEK